MDQVRDQIYSGKDYLFYLVGRIAEGFRNFISDVDNSEHRKMRAKQQHVCKEMNI
jgi:hypothetical protein